SSHFLTLLDEFMTQGSHLCIVTELLGTTLSEMWEIFKISIDRKAFSLDVAVSVVVQLALGLAELHRRGVVHGGKVPPGRAINEFESVKELLEMFRDAIKGHRSL